MSFTVTAKLKRFARQRLGVRSGDSDRRVKAKVGEAIKSGKLSLRQLNELTGSGRSESASQSRSESGSGSLSGSLSAYFRRSLDQRGRRLRSEIKAAEKAAMKRIGKAQKRLEDVKAGTDGGVALKFTPAALYGKSDTDSRLRVKSVAEQFSGKTKAAICPVKTLSGGVHPRAGKPAIGFEGTILDEPSELSKAVALAYVKWHLACCTGTKSDIPRGLRMTELDDRLVAYAINEMKWVGEIKPATSGSNWSKNDGAAKWDINRSKLNLDQKADLLDDSGSGGIFAAPIVFDDMVVLTPVLYGELFPRVKIVNITRGRRIQGFAMTNPTVTDGVNEGTAITPFDATAFISAFNTNIFPAVAAMRLGLDFEEDAPNDIAGLIAERFGLKFLEYLDNQIANGNGTTQPAGLFGTSGAITVNSDNSTGGPPTVSDYEALMFGVAKQYRFEPGANCAFVGNETSYRRARGIPVGPGDDRRVFLMDEGNYKLFEYPYAINAGIPNSSVAFVNLNRYRMYRRLGLQLRIETAGATLALANQKLLVLRQRFGGQMELGGAIALALDMQS